MLCSWSGIAQFAVGHSLAQMHMGDLAVTLGQAFSTNLNIPIPAVQAAAAYVVQIGQHGHIRAWACQA